MAPAPPTKSTRGLDSGLQTKIPFDMFHIYYTSVFMRNFEKILTTDSVIAQELDVGISSLLVYPLRSRGKDGHSAAAQIVSG